MKLKQLALLFAQKRRKLFIAIFYARGEQLRFSNSPVSSCPFSDDPSSSCTLDFAIRSTNKSAILLTVSNEAGEHVLAIG